MVLAGVVGCFPPKVEYEGTEYPPVATEQQIAFLETAPADEWETLGTLRAHCSPGSSGCDEETMVAEMTRRAAAVGATVIYGLKCNYDGGKTKTFFRDEETASHDCTAWTARPLKSP